MRMVKRLSVCQSLLRSKPLYLRAIRYDTLGVYLEPHGATDWWWLPRMLEARVRFHWPHAVGVAFYPTEENNDFLLVE